MRRNAIAFPAGRGAGRARKPGRASECAGGSRRRRDHVRSARSGGL